jgi:hypothetical protein
MDAQIVNLLIQLPLAGVFFYQLRILWDKLNSQETRIEKISAEAQAERKTVQNERKEELSRLLLSLDASTRAIERNTEMYGEVIEKFKDK